MNGQMRNKARLLARASTLAILAAAGSLGAVQQAYAACPTPFFVPGDGQTVTGTQDCVKVNADVTAGNVINNAVVGDPGSGIIPFEVYANIAGQLINNGSVTGGYFAGTGSQFGALTIRNDKTISGGIFNSGTGFITSSTGNAVQIGLGGENAGFVDGGITNANAITSGAGYGIAAIEGGLTGGFTNQFGATLSGGLAALYIDDGFTGDWAGGITNYGQISGVAGGIVMGDGDGGAGTVDFSGGISNHNAITSVGGAAILITNDIATFAGSVTNSGQITGASDAIYIGSNTFSGDVVNDGDIIGGTGGEYGRGLVIGASTVNGVGGAGNAQITNHALIRGHSAGLVVFGGTVNADVTNSPSAPFAPDPVIEATDGTGAILAAESWSGNVTNDGTIKGTEFGMVIGATFSDGTNFITDDFTGTITNNGLIQGSDEGDGETGLYVGFGSFTGDIVNTGTILGDDNGLTVQGASSCCYYYGGRPFDGTITNSGRIAGNDTGVHISGVNFTGDFNNQSNGVISGGDAGLRFVGASTDYIFANKGTFEGTFTNTGSITGGDTGVAISFDTFDGDFTNNGYIEGGIDGVIISANTITGNITNNGAIIGNGLDTGLHVIAGTMTGDVVNNDYLSAPSNALHVEIGTLNGSIVNTGTIEATSAGSTAVRLEVGNGTTFTNTDGGVILGDILFAGKAPYDFVGEDGGIEGDMLGDYSGGATPADADTITVQNGEHYFFGGKASNFSTFTVDAGGVAVMGSRGVGSESRSAYSFGNVDNVAVNNGGALYIDKSTTLNVDNNYTQAAGGTLMFYLGAPGGEGSFPDLTGTQVAGPGDYGQLLVGGTASLDGTIGGFLDPNYASANPGLNEVVYNDVIIADDGISGDFTTTALIANNSLFELDSLIDGNTVDLRVLRSSLGSVSAPSNIVNTGDPFDANIAQYSGGGGCAVAGFGWCTNRYAANEPGATSVMTDATPGEDPFAWLRAGNRTVGETAAWGRAVGVWGETDGDGLRPGTDFSLGGAIVGIDRVFEPLLLAGVAVQWTTADIDFDLATGDAKVDSLEVGAYASYGDARLFVNANVSYIWHDFEVNRVTGPNRARGDYDGNTYSGYVEGGKTFLTDGGLRIQPLVALSYSHLDTDAYTETGTGTLLNVSDADLDSLKSMTGARFAYSFATDSGRSLIPEARILWSHEFMDDRASHLVDPVGGPVVWTSVDGKEFSRDTLVLGGGLTASMSASTTVFIDYDAGINSDITSHTVSAGFRTRW